MTGARISRVWKGSAGDRAAMAVQGRVLRRRPATTGERKQAGLDHDHDAQALALRTCQGTFVCVTPDRAVGEYALLANALAVEWNRPRAETMQAIAATLNADDATLADLASTLITAHTICRKPKPGCACHYAALFAAPVSDAPAIGETLGEHIAVHGETPSDILTSDRVQRDKSRFAVITRMRAELNGGA